MFGHASSSWDHRPVIVALARGLMIERIFATGRAELILFHAIAACLFGFADWLLRHPSSPCAKRGTIARNDGRPRCDSMRKLPTKCVGLCPE